MPFLSTFATEECYYRNGLFLFSTSRINYIHPLMQKFCSELFDLFQNTKFDERIYVLIPSYVLMGVIINFKKLKISRNIRKKKGGSAQLSWPILVFLD